MPVLCTDLCRVLFPKRSNILENITGVHHVHPPKGHRQCRTRGDERAHPPALLPRPATPRAEAAAPGWFSATSKSECSDWCCWQREARPCPGRASARTHWSLSLPFTGNGVASVPLAEQDVLSRSVSTCSASMPIHINCNRGKEIPAVLVSEPQTVKGPHVQKTCRIISKTLLSSKAAPASEGCC